MRDAAASAAATELPRASHRIPARSRRAGAGVQGAAVGLWGCSHPGVGPRGTGAAIPQHPRVSCGGIRRYPAAPQGSPQHPTDIPEHPWVPHSIRGVSCSIPRPPGAFSSIPEYPTAALEDPAPGFQEDPAPGFREEFLPGHRWEQTEQIFPGKIPGSKDPPSLDSRDLSSFAPLQCRSRSRHRDLGWLRAGIGCAGAERQGSISRRIYGFWEQGR